MKIYNVLLEGIVLKPNMIISAIDCPVQANIEKVADMTYQCLQENVPIDIMEYTFAPKVAFRLQEQLFATK